MVLLYDSNSLIQIKNRIILLQLENNHLIKLDINNNYKYVIQLLNDFINNYYCEKSVFNIYKLDLIHSIQNIINMHIIEIYENNNDDYYIYINNNNQYFDLLNKLSIINANIANITSPNNILPNYNNIKIIKIHKKPNIENESLNDELDYIIQERIKIKKIKIKKIKMVKKKYSKINNKENISIDYKKSYISI
jgi:hypothetical protein